MKKIVLYFHGFPGSRLEIEFLHQSAMREGISFIAFDRPGMGQSEYDESRSVSSVTAIIEAFVTLYKIDSFLVLGVSGGTPYALTTTAYFPAQVQSTMIVSGVASLKDKRTLSFMQPFDRAVLFLVARYPWFSRWPIFFIWCLLRTIPKIMRHLFIATLPRPDRQILNTAASKKFFLRILREAISGSYKGVHKELELLVSEWHIPFRNIHTPVIFHHGKDDTFVPPEMSRINAHALGSPAAVFIKPAGGHFMFLMMAEEICQWAKSTFSAKA